MHREAIKRAAKLLRAAVLQVEALLLPWDLHGLACRRQLSKLCPWSTTYLNAVPEDARHRWRSHEDPVARHVSKSLADILSSTSQDMQFARHTQLVLWSLPSRPHSQSATAD